MRTTNVLVGAVLALGCGSDGDENCADRGTPVPGYEHKDGEGAHVGRPCVESGCHLLADLGPQAPAYAIAGTVFKSDQTTPQTGITVRLTPLASGVEPVTLQTDADGNFYLELTTATNPFPAIPEVSACPNTETMLEGALDPSYGNCNANGCHELGGGIGPGSITLD